MYFFVCFLTNHSKNVGHCGLKYTFISASKYYKANSRMEEMSTEYSDMLTLQKKKKNRKDPCCLEFKGVGVTSPLGFQ